MYEREGMITSFSEHNFSQSSCCGLQNATLFRRMCVWMHINFVQRMLTKLVSYVTDVEKMACLLMLKITGKQKMWEKKKKRIQHKPHWFPIPEDCFKYCHIETNLLWFASLISPLWFLFASFNKGARSSLYQN